MQRVVGIGTLAGSRRPRPVLAALALLLALLVLFSGVSPAYAQSEMEEADDANRTATTPEECVRPPAPGDSMTPSEISAQVEAKQAYDDCLKRTEGASGGGEDDSSTESDPSEANGNATQPEECVKPEVPDSDSDLGAASDYEEAQESYQDCLRETGFGGEAGGSEEGAAPGGESTTPTDSSSECEAPADNASLSKQQDYEDCLAGSGGLTDDDGTAAPTTTAEGDDGGLTGMVIGFFQGILQWTWDNTVGWALEQMAEAFKTNLLSLPDLEARGGLLDFYSSSVAKLRPIILVGILVLGITVMVRHDNTDLAYAGFYGLPKLMGVAIAMAFLPQFMGELARITAGITEAFYPSGGDVSASGQELFKAAIGNMATSNFLNVILLLFAAWVGGLVVIVALLNKVLYSILFVSGAFALAASIVPTMNSLAGSWFRGVVASAAIPALWSIELGVGSFIVASPESVFGEMTNSLGFISESAVTSLGAILTMWIMYKTPFKCIEWAWNVQLPGRGGLMGLAKAGASLAIAVPLKTAITTGVKNMMSRGSGAGAGGAVSRNARELTGGAGGSGPKQKGPGASARKIQQIGNQGKRDRATQNAVKTVYQNTSPTTRYTGEGGGKERFMNGRSNKSGGDGHGMKAPRSGDRRTTK